MPILLYYGVDKRDEDTKKGYKYERNRASMQNYALFQTSKPGKACRRTRLFTANISNFERGLVRISLDLALAYSDYFNVSLDYIVKGQLILPEDTKYRLDNGRI